MDINYQALETISGRYITLVEVEKIVNSLSLNKFSIRVEGVSVENRPLYSVRFGYGSKKIIIWSHMHGNESTTTKAVLDWLNELNKNESYFNDIAKHFEICVLPMVNPDGAFNYTRVNANQVDLNRDSVQLSQPESVFLNKMLTSFNAHLALNLHDQRTIFGVGDDPNPATISFLAPAFNETRDVNETRTIAMKLIGAMVEHLKKEIPNNIGRFDDSFNINCIGDFVTNMGIPTILFEAGHFKNDYQREISRRFVYEALFTLLEAYKTDDYLNISTDVYWNVKENNKSFTDIRIENFVNETEDLIKKEAICVQYVENIQNNKLFFDYSLDFDSAPDAKYGHKILNANGLKVKSEEDIFGFLHENVEKV